MTGERSQQNPGMPSPTLGWHPGIYWSCVVTKELHSWFITVGFTLRGILGTFKKNSHNAAFEVILSAMFQQ